MKDSTSSNLTKCPACGRKYLHPKRIADALRLVKSGVRQSAAARATGISRQRLSQIIRANEN